MWRHREPVRSDYETEQDYMDAMAAYDAAEFQHECECRERYYEEKFNQ